MTDYYVVWHDIEDYEPRRTFELIRVSPEKISPQDTSMPRVAGLKTAYIRWHRHQFGEHQLYLVTYTHHQLQPAEVQELVDRAIKFVQGQDKTHQSSPVGRRNYDPKRAEALRSELAGTIARFLANHPDTLKSEILAALEATRQAHQK